MKKNQITLSFTKSSLNRIIAKSAKIRKKRNQSIGTENPYLEIYLYLTNYIIGTGKYNHFNEAFYYVSSFWTPERIDLLIVESRYLYTYKYLTRSDHSTRVQYEEIIGSLSFDNRLGTILSWFDEFKLVD